MIAGARLNQSNYITALQPSSWNLHRRLPSGWCVRSLWDSFSVYYIDVHSVYVCHKYPCRSGSDWSESFNVAAAWFNGVQHRIYLDYDTVNKLFHKCFTNSASIINLSHSSKWLQPLVCAHQSQSLDIIATCAPEQITAELTSMTYLKKQSDLYLQRCEQDWDFASGQSRSVHLNWLLWINETKWVRTESVPVWGDPDTWGQRSGIGICGCLSVASC